MWQVDDPCALPAGALDDPLVSLSLNVTTCTESPDTTTATTPALPSASPSDTATSGAAILPQQQLSLPTPHFSSNRSARAGRKDSYCRMCWIVRVA